MKSDSEKYAPAPVCVPAGDGDAYDIAAKVAKDHWDDLNKEEEVSLANFQDLASDVVRAITAAPSPASDGVRETDGEKA